MGYLEYCNENMPHTQVTVPMAILYIILFLHQTTTSSGSTMRRALLYIILFLHQTTTCNHPTRFHHWLYIILFLHQTTTCIVKHMAGRRCISSYSYIKPQHRLYYVLYFKHLHLLYCLRSGIMRRILWQNY